MMEYDSATKRGETGSFVETWVDQELTCRKRKVSIIYYCIHVESEKWRRRTYLQEESCRRREWIRGRGRGGGGGMDWGLQLRCVHHHVKQTASGELPSTGTSARCRVMTSRGGRAAWEGWPGGDPCTQRADSLHGPAATNTTLYSNYTPI